MKIFRRKSDYSKIVDSNDWILPQDINVEPKLGIEVNHVEIEAWNLFLDRFPNLPQNHFDKLDQMALHGIPENIRKKAYLILTNSHNANQFPLPPLDDLPQEMIDMNKNQIHNDVKRTYKCMLWMMKPENKERSEKLLTHLMLSDAALGYSQGMNYFVPLFASIMNDCKTYWTIYHLFHDEIHNQAYIMDPSMEGLMFHLKVHDVFLQAKIPKIYKIMKTLEIDPILYVPQWMLTAGLGLSMPSSLVYLILDRYVYFGQRSTHSLILAFIKCQENLIAKATQQKDIHEILNNFGNLFFETNLKDFIKNWDGLMIPSPDYTAVIAFVNK
ncbi:hypothetical protein TRFO_03456 [Tritrichomonas foetus]|uniref:Rab-GAP TBC domain-containing protein n=1 Tax=Tritrichomonas foetus TaxID=1144522 RepID=A0A1J4KPK9_9EUKA|nr:hypothetical protein TRFO_03456 [Tritrichomonas foetus]|eukprot:OHT13042.1 hypothetical protein TRFO_03456 [Tritrichomonas foetus]